MSRFSAVTAAVISAACFGTLAIFASLAYTEGAVPLQLLTWRFALASVLLGLYVVITAPGGLRITSVDLGRYAAISLLGYGAASVCFFFALKHADASVVAILLYSYPAMVVLAEGAFLGVRPSRARLIAVLLTFVGCVFVLDPAASVAAVDGKGVVLGLGAALGYSVFTILSHRWMEGRSRLTLMTYLFMFTAALGAAAALLTGTSLAIGAWSAQVWWLLGAIVLLPTFVAVLLYLRALSGLGAGQAAILSTVEPVFTIALAAVVLQERLTPTQWIGAALVVAGVFVAERGGRPAQEIAIV
ncbi:MAG: DMT family transporter [Coriobacteriia bacterium]